MRFYLGTHEPAWLGRTTAPLFVSHRRLARRKSMPRAIGTWALDSGGFTELSMHGQWLTSPATYAAAAQRYQEEIGGLDWAAPQDYMCEPFMLERTGLSIAEHQARTIESVLELRALAPRVPFVPVLQGWELADYLRCVELYADAGIDVTVEPTVGIGSVCRRQATDEIADIVSELAECGIRLHGFGVKVLGLRAYGRHLASSDSMAWSLNARNRPPLEGHTHQSCANCIDWAMNFRAKALEAAAA